MIQLGWGVHDPLGTCLVDGTMPVHPQLLILDRNRSYGDHRNDSEALLGNPVSLPLENCGQRLELVKL